MDIYQNLLIRVNRIEERLNLWDKRKVKDLEILLYSLYASLNAMRSFLGTNEEENIETFDLTITAPIISAGSILFIKKLQFQGQLLEYIDDSYYSDMNLKGVFKSGEDLVLTDNSVPEMAISNEYLPRYIYNRFENGIPPEKTIQIASKEILEDPNDPKVVFCVPSRIADKTPYKPFIKVKDTSPVKISFILEEKTTAELGFEKKYPATYMHKIGQKKRAFTSQSTTKLSIPTDVFGGNQKYWTFDPFSARLNGIMINKTILWFNPLE